MIKEKLFHKPNIKSRVRLSAIKELETELAELAKVNSEHFLSYQAIIKEDGEYLLTRSGPADLTPLVFFLEDKELSLEMKVQWLLNILKLIPNIEEAAFRWHGLKLADFFVDQTGKIYLMPEPVVRMKVKYDNRINLQAETAYYQPPEVIEGDEWDRQALIFNLGAIFYRILTGQKIFSEQDQAVVLEKITKEELSEPRYLNYNLSLKLNNLLLKMLRRNREDRYQNWQKIIDDLESILKNNSYQATTTEINNNANKGPRYLKWKNIQESFALFVRRKGKIVAFFTIIIGLLVWGVFSGGPAAVVNKNTTPHEVVSFFYQGFEQKNINLLEQTTSVDLNNLSRLVSETHVIESMQQLYNTNPLSKEGQTEQGNDSNLVEKNKSVYLIKGLRIKEVVTSGKDYQFTAEYLLKFRDYDELENIEMKDRLILAKLNEKWQIIAIEGDLQAIITGDWQQMSEDNSQ